MGIKNIRTALACLEYEAQGNKTKYKDSIMRFWQLPIEYDFTVSWYVFKRGFKGKLIKLLKDFEDSQ